MRKTPFLVALALLAALGSNGISRRAAAQDPPAEVLLKEAQDAESASKNDDAAKVYKRLLDLYPKDAGAPRVRLRLGLLLAKLGKVEDARARLREARATGKGDEALCAEAEKALLALPPAPEPKAEKPKPAPAPAPETGPRAELQAEIAKLEDEVRAMIKRAQELEDGGQQGDAFALRAQADKATATIDAKKKELAALSRAPAKRERPIDKKLEKLEKKGDDEPKQNEQKRKMMARRRDELESTAKQAEQRAAVLAGTNRAGEAAASLEQAARARREAFEISKRLEKAEKDAKDAKDKPADKPADKVEPAKPAAANPKAQAEAQPSQTAAPERPIDPFLRREAEARENVKTARAAVTEAEKANDPARLKKAKEDLAAAQKTLQTATAEREDAAERLQLERLAEQLKKRGAPAWEVEERLALAKKEAAFEREHRQKRRKLDEPAAAELDKEHRGAIERLRAEGEERIAARGRAELDKELKEKQAELVARGASEEEATRKVAGMRREREAKMGLAKKDAKDDDDLPEEKGGKRMKRILEENQRLRRRVEELEKENAALKKGEMKAD